MTIEQENDLIRRALLSAAALDFGALSGETPPISPRQAKRMKAMVADPFGYARRVRRPAWKKALHTAAMVAVAVALSLSLLSAVSPTVRAAIKAWFMEVRRSDIVYYFTGETKDEELPYYTITELPDGYEATGETIEQPGYRLIEFRNAVGQRITLEYNNMEDGTAFWISTDDMQVYDITVNGCPGQIYISMDKKESNSILWTDEECNTQFCLDGFVDKLELLHMADSVSLYKTEKP